ncbi:beta-1,3-galactosyltransferase 6-like [Tigriopus californicus]|uniref:beta-1,3-galactosyltransferase 6-like n=1 Tax=Tigriopus californicus TaxID=6832 RepID=UPI0027DAAE5E|nr:beta-1,3-galactosyltransferase 6-like [Tigriopus californicus]
MSLINVRLLRTPTLALSCLLFFALGNFIAHQFQAQSGCIHQLDPGHEALSELREGYHGLKTQKTFLLVMILSSPSNVERRKAIRQTWLNLAPNVKAEVLPLFVLGDLTLATKEEELIQSENLAYKDLLILPVEDAFDLLTKKVLATLVQLDRNVQFKYLLKVDDDTYVDVPKMLDELKNSNYESALYWGLFDGRAPVFRSPRSKWQEADYFLCDKYIPYALGGGYVLSQDLVHFIAENADLLKLYKNEDVSVGTWLAPLKVNRVHDTRFDTEARSRGCSKEFIVTHKQSVENMRDKHRHLTEKGTLCDGDPHLIPIYEYNWKVPPSKCCERP